MHAAHRPDRRPRADARHRVAQARRAQGRARAAGRNAAGARPGGRSGRPLPRVRPRGGPQASGRRVAGDPVPLCRGVSGTAARARGPARASCTSSAIRRRSTTARRRRWWALGAGRRTGWRSRGRSAGASRRLACRWCRAWRLAWMRRRIRARSRPTGRRSRCWPAGPMCRIPPCTGACTAAWPRVGASCRSCRPASVRCAGASWPATASSRGSAEITVVVEATVRSGSLTTADFAANAGRQVAAVPGPVTSRLAEGTNGLIAAGAALVRDARDVLELAAGPGRGARQRREPRPPGAPAGRPGDRARSAAARPARRRGAGPRLA